MFEKKSSDEDWLVKNVYLPTREKTLKEIGTRNIDIKVLQRTNPNLVVAQRTLSTDSQGKPKSTQEITAGEHLKTLEEQREGLKMRLMSIDLLIQNNE